MTDLARAKALVQHLSTGVGCPGHDELTFIAFDHGLWRVSAKGVGVVGEGPTGEEALQDFLRGCVERVALQLQSAEADVRELRALLGEP